MRADLHTHTNHSDGKYSVEALLDLAIKNNLDIISITDHDTFDGVKEALKLKRDIRIVIGVEFSTTRNDENIHILSYFKDLDGITDLELILEKQIFNRNKRAYMVLDKLKEHFNIDLNPGFIKEVKGVTRGTIAREIKKQGYDYSNRIIFKYMIGEGCPAYIPSSKISAEDGIQAVKAAGGLAVLAHPMFLEKNDVEDIIKLGIDGIEARYPHKFDQEDKYRKIAKENHLFVTAGSDFHDFDDGRHGNIGSVYLQGKDLDVFLEVLYECEKTCI